MALKALDQRMAGGVTNPARPATSTSNANGPTSPMVTNGVAAPKASDPVGVTERENNEGA